MSSSEQFALAGSIMVAAAPIPTNKDMDEGSVGVLGARRLPPGFLDFLAGLSGSPGSGFPSPSSQFPIGFPGFSGPPSGFPPFNISNLPPVGSLPGFGSLNIPDLSSLNIPGLSSLPGLCSLTGLLGGTGSPHSGGQTKPENAVHGDLLGGLLGPVLGLVTGLLGGLGRSS
ncbi:uncharacterized protein B0I36DRAFT_400625 [Microdochium trichocladiopsis]|uniref:Uncharacterized protein n=1 Tax=Microdochium trichocladiopsis TaxID=1682393 RepID=A0A9P8XQ68_9PEZI|nr:uncharacterized protein B0I36DRAFT_436913 [Microdochium trichocladiopsis]XP_046004292.1 uncharacterized protein B0I36DRAFT_400625 [Microdochium trichocladiopsis]KAH7010600.1 hypothetical protein B0I36DRAFT_436913 [Microdochium trichocladiopsis]KAH7010807.1 hypothetical protein B0I36DRAFT_400625 [Microdochium trichocladiopsis]